MSKLFDENYDQTKSMYDSLPAGKQAEFKAIFNGKDVMKDSQTSGMWLAENEDEDEELEGAMQQILAIMATCPDSDQTVV